MADVLAQLRGKGVQLWLENGRLRYRAPRGALTSEDVETLRAGSGEIVALLEGGGAAAAVRAPLAYSQLAHWRLHRLDERPAIRQIASATRMLGRLDLGALGEAMAALARRHHALRTRLLTLEGEPMQEVLPPRPGQLPLIDLSAAPDGVRDAQVQGAFEELIMEPIDVASGPLFGARVLRLAPAEHVLLTAMEHSVSDAYSRGVLLRELLTAYEHKLRGQACALAPIGMQFWEYAQRQRALAAQWVEAHGEYWRRICGRHAGMQFPEDPTAPREAPGQGVAPVRIGKELRARLGEWSRARGVTLPLAAFTAYACLVLRWCNASSALIRYMIDGRSCPELEHTIGYFASSLYVCVDPGRDATLLDLMAHVSAEYVRAYQHADDSWMAAQLPRPPFTLNTGFNWVPHAPEPRMGMAQGRSFAPIERLECAQLRFAHPMLKTHQFDSEPSLLLYDDGAEVAGDVYYPTRRFHAATMQRFACNFLEILRALLERPTVRVREITMAS